MDVHRHEIGFSTAPDEDVVAIGDVHGRSDLLIELLALADGIPSSGRRRTLVFTGDLIDRGPASGACVDLAMTASVGDVKVALMGNHEAMMLTGLAGETPKAWAMRSLWEDNGGDRFCRELAGDYAALHTRERLLAGLGHRRHRWLLAMASNWRCGDLLFVHAGVHPEYDKETFLGTRWDADMRRVRQDYHWAWIRRPFLDAASHGGSFVVHGHSPDDGAARTGADVVSRDRLNLDLGSHATGRARMAHFVGRTVTVYDVRGGVEAYPHAA